MAFDGVVREPIPRNARVIAYADDILLLVENHSIDDLITDTEIALAILERRIERLSLKLAPHKTEAVIFSRRRNIVTKYINVSRHRIKVKNQMKYLGIILDSGLTFEPHIRSMVTRAEHTLRSLISLMRNTSGPSGKKRKMYITMVNSII